MAAATNDPVNLPLDDRLCLALYTASRAMTARYRPLLAELDLTYPQYLVMVLLWEDGDSAMNVIGDRLSLESSTLSPLVRRLEAAHLVERRRNPDDERSVIVRLTAEGSALSRRADHVPAVICDAAGFSMQHQAELVADLRALASQLETSTAQATATPVAHD